MFGGRYQYLLFLLVVYLVAATDYRVALLLSISNADGTHTPLQRLAQASFDYGIEMVNNGTLVSLGDGDRLVPVYGNVKNVLNGAFFRTLELADYCNQSVPVDVVIGPQLSREATVAGLLAAQFDLPVLAIASAPELSDKALYPTVSRLNTPLVFQAHAMLQLIRYFNWQRVLVVFTSDSFGSGLLVPFTNEARMFGIEIVQAFGFPAGTVNRQPIIDVVQAIRSSGIFVIVTMCINTDTIMLIQEARKQNLTQSPFVWVGNHANVDNLPAGSVSTNINLGQDRPQWKQWQQAIHTIANVPASQQPQDAFALITDSVLFYAHTVLQFKRLQQQCLNSSGVNRTDCILLNTRRGWLMSQITRNTTMSDIGVTGAVQLDQNGDRALQFCIYNKYNSSQPAIRVAFINSTTGVVQPLQAVVWADQTTHVPPDHTAHGPLDGDRLDITVNTALFVLAFGVSMIGAWTSLVLLEHIAKPTTSFATKTHSNVMKIGMDYHATLWLVASTVALGIGQWSAILIHYAAVETTNTVVFFAAAPTFLSMCITLVCSGAALRFMVWSHEQKDNTVTSINNTLHHHGKPASASSVSLTSAMLFGVGARGVCHCNGFGLYGAFTMIGGLLVVCGISGTDAIMRQFAVQQSCVVRHVSAGYTLLAIVTMCVLIAPSLWMFVYLRKSQFRSVAALLMAFASSTYEWVQFFTSTYHYDSSLCHKAKPASVVTPSTLLLTGCVTTALTSFFLMWLNTSRLRLSKDALDHYLLKAQTKMLHMEHTVDAQLYQIQALEEALSLIRLCRPVPTEQKHDQQQENNYQIHHYHYMLEQLSTDNERYHHHQPERTMIRQYDHQDDSKHMQPSQRSLPDATTTPLVRLIANPVANELLKDVMITHHMYENLMFLLDVAEYRRVDTNSTPGKRRTICQHIRETYVHANSTSPINISGSLRDTLLQRTHPDSSIPLDTHLFAEAEAELLLLIETNILPRWQDTPSYALATLVVSHFTKRYPHLFVPVFEHRSAIQQHRRFASTTVESARKPSPPRPQPTTEPTQQREPSTGDMNVAPTAKAVFRNQSLPPSEPCSTIVMVAPAPPPTPLTQPVAPKRDTYM